MEKVNKPLHSRSNSINADLCEGIAQIWSWQAIGETWLRKQTERRRWISSSICVKTIISHHGARRGNIIVNINSYAPALLAVI